MLTVGQLARIFNVSAKTLRHYDAVGLFTPVKVGEENQYRFYSPEQLHELRRILFLRSMGLGIEIIRELKQRDAGGCRKVEADPLGARRQHS
ncbi:MerR family transcriptional regulator [Paenibacillus ehimensis]|uniref:MerR family transcriptional regulator n=1 Tax=Paenibacillus ehimensis TaxID=79264 RepID=UPI000FD7C98B|nr:MerR family transcriptional regulator [Paenibacillus ehimensis]